MPDMSHKRRVVMLLLLPAVMLSAALLYIPAQRNHAPDRPLRIDRTPVLRPDYSNTVIPPNIAPLNFLVDEIGSHYYVKIYSAQGKPIEVSNRTGRILIPQNQWRRLLTENKSQTLYFDVFVKAKDGRWCLYSTIKSKIAGEPIDRFLVYRRMHPTHTHRLGTVALCQRDLENFHELVILDNGYYKGGCLNCHTFCNGRTDKMLMGVRAPKYGTSTLLVENGAVTKIDAKFGYTSWHPSGRLAAYSIDKLPMFFHSARNEVRDTIDLNSALAYFALDSRTIKTSPKIADKSRLETWPAWSPDGRFLYFCSAPMLWSDPTRFPAALYKKVKYDLVRISYDIDNDQWGEVETVIAAADTGRSAAMPKVSPDGRWLLFCMCDYGYFPPWQQNSDFYIIDLQNAQQTGRYSYSRLDINSDQAEAWHTWSSNSRWIVFTSKRDQGVFTRCYISYVDAEGKVHNPLLLPQKDPAFYDSCLESHNTPELVTEPIPVTGEKLARAIRGSDKILVDMPITGATPKAGLGTGYGQQSE
jgi:hypothetical protein